MGDALNQNDCDVAWKLNNEIWKFLNQIMNEASSVQNKPKNEFGVIPNPTSDFIGIYSPQYQTKFLGKQVEIYNLMGKCLFKENIQGLDSMWLDIRELPIGIYILKIEEATKIFVKINY